MHQNENLKHFGAFFFMLKRWCIYQKINIPLKTFNEKWIGSHQSFYKRLNYLSEGNCVFIGELRRLDNFSLPTFMIHFKIIFEDELGNGNNIIALFFQSLDNGI